METSGDLHRRGPQAVARAGARGWSAPRLPPVACSSGGIPRNPAFLQKQLSATLFMPVSLRSPCALCSQPRAPLQSLILHPTPASGLCTFCSSRLLSRSFPGCLPRHSGFVGSVTSAEGEAFPHQPGQPFLSRGLHTTFIANNYPGFSVAALPGAPAFPSVAQPHSRLQDTFLLPCHVQSPPPWQDPGGRT